jgi:hypothetical protein
MRRFILIPSILACLAVLASCGGDDNGEFVLPLGKLNCAAVAVLNSYHYDSDVLIEVTAPDGTGTPPPMDPSPLKVTWRSEVDVEEGGDLIQGVVKTNDGGRESSLDVIAVGSDVWQQSNPNIGFIKAKQGSVPPFPYPPADVCEGLRDDLDLASMSVTPEKVNGVKSVKFALVELPSGALADAVSFGAGDAATVVRSYNGAIWVMEDGYPSKLELSGSGQYEGGSTIRVEVSFEYSHINDVDTQITAPQRAQGGQ